MKGMLSLDCGRGDGRRAGRAGAGKKMVFRASGNWTADYGDDYCRLIRTFSDGTAQMKPRARAAPAGRAWCG